MSINPKEPIHPCNLGPAYTDSDGYTHFQQSNIGLTKREYFAAIAMQGLISNTLISFESVVHNDLIYANTNPEIRMKQVLILADTMIKLLNESNDL